ncbi:hypothetical protein JOE57_001408 [Microlunatus panaciterrae]|uniref:Uncharacterized protein n=1 Tax=Microlunatus panaciterrae TaxID=400768 RepID=A0ABS2RIY7_9ACTN|nr:hypothetical protein [Microlunatus panaciterrae]MBM7798487.1 hypothetical protein [Microlunatus panaciterrae]
MPGLRGESSGGCRWKSSIGQRADLAPLEEQGGLDRRICLEGEVDVSEDEVSGLLLSVGIERVSQRLTGKCPPCWRPQTANLEAVGFVFGEQQFERPATLSKIGQHARASRQVPVDFLNSTESLDRPVDSPDVPPCGRPQPHIEVA